MITFGERIEEKDVLRYINGVRTLCAESSKISKFKTLLQRLRNENTLLFESLHKMQQLEHSEEHGSIITLRPYQIQTLQWMNALISHIEQLRIPRSYGLSIIPVMERIIHSIIVPK